MRAWRVPLVSPNKISLAGRISRQENYRTLFHTIQVVSRIKRSSVVEKVNFCRIEENDLLPVGDRRLILRVCETVEFDVAAAQGYTQNISRGLPTVSIPTSVSKAEILSQK